MSSWYPDNCIEFFKGWQLVLGALAEREKYLLKYFGSAFVPSPPMQASRPMFSGVPEMLMRRLQSRILNALSGCYDPRKFGEWTNGQPLAGINGSDRRDDLFELITSVGGYPEDFMLEVRPARVNSWRFLKSCFLLMDKAVLYPAPGLPGIRADYCKYDLASGEILDSTQIINPAESVVWDTTNYEDYHTVNCSDYEIVCLAKIPPPGTVYWRYSLKFVYYGRYTPDNKIVYEQKDISATGQKIAALQNGGPVPFTDMYPEPWKKEILSTDADGKYRGGRRYISMQFTEASQMKISRADFEQPPYKYWNKQE